MIQIDIVDNYDMVWFTTWHDIFVQNVHEGYHMDNISVDVAPIISSGGGYENNAWLIRKVKFIKTFITHIP